jgi:epoxide hydrolase 4
VKKVGSTLSTPSRNLQHVMVPTLLIWGEQDPFKVIEVIQEIQPYVPQLTVQRIPNGTHWIVYEQPERINELIHDFITTTV